MPFHTFGMRIFLPALLSSARPGNAGKWENFESQEKQEGKM
jgi:hypothetical protein